MRNKGLSVFSANWQVGARLCLTTHRERAVFTQSTAPDGWSGLSDLSEGCGGGRSTITVNDSYSCCSSPTGTSNSPERERRRKGGDATWERATLLQRFTSRALAACKLPTFLTDREVGLNKQGHTIEREKASTCTCWIVSLMRRIFFTFKMFTTSDVRFIILQKKKNPLTTMLTSWLSASIMFAKCHFTESYARLH